MQHAERERKGKKSPLPPPPSNEKAKHGLGLFYIHIHKLGSEIVTRAAFFLVTGNIFYLGAASLLIGRTQSFDFYKKMRLCSEAIKPGYGS
jgi:hypothetical protein